MSKENNPTLAGLQEALQVELSKADKSNLETIKELVNASAELVDREYVLKAEVADAAELEQRVAELEEEIAAERAKQVNPREAIMHKINGGKSLETIVITEMDDDGKILAAQKIKARLTVASISTRQGQYQASEIIANPELYAETVQRLVERKSSALVIEASKDLTKKELDKLNKG